MGPPTEGEPEPPRDERPEADEPASGGGVPASPAPTFTSEPPPAGAGTSLPQGWSVGPTTPLDAGGAAPVPAVQPKLRIGSVLGRTLDEFVSHPLEFASLAIPAGLIALLSVLVDVNRIGVSGQVALSIVTTVAGIVFGLAMIVAADDVRGGRPIDLGAAIATGLARTVTAILSAMVLVLIVLGLALLLFVVAGILGLANLALGVIVALAALLVILYIGIRWALAEAAIVLDRQGPLAALNRSWSVTRGNALRMVALYVLLGLITLPLGFGIGLLALAAPDVRIGGVLGALVTLVTAPIAAIASTLVYGDLTGRPFDEAANPPRPLGRWVLAGTLVVLGVIGLVIAIPNLPAAYDRLLNRSIPAADRGVIRFGTAANPGNPCQPLNTKTDFATTEPIYIGGYFTTVVPAGQNATESVYANGTLLGSGQLTGTGQSAACLSEASPITGAPPGSYRIDVTYQGQTISSGEFTVH
jgi:hypothetical protein